MISVLGVFNADLKFMVERFPKNGETLHGLSFEVQPGGKGFNQAVGAIRASDEQAVCMLTQLGEDNFAEMARGVMARENIDATHILSTPAMPTGTAMIMVERDSADNMIVIAPGAASLLRKSHVDGFSNAIIASSLLMTNFEAPMEAVVAGIEVANKNGVATLLDPAPAIDMERELYKKLDYITPNESEAAVLVGFDVDTLEDGERAARELCGRGVGTAIVTMGQKGVVAVSNEETICLPAFELQNAVDSTGAGDAFNGGFAARIVAGASLREALLFASAGAALCVTRYGAADAMASHEEIETFLSANIT